MLFKESLGAAIMDRDEKRARAMEEEDFVHSPKFNNSLKRFLAKNDEGVENETIAKILGMTPEEVEAIYQEAVQELREEMSDE